MTIKETLPEPRARIGVVYAGGTISSLATPQGYREDGHSVDLVDRLEERVRNFKNSFELGGTQVAYTGLSENMDEGYWQNITSATKDSLQRNKAVVITHGTDCMEQTARHLQKALGEILTKNGARVVLTGANEDLMHPQTDAWDNLVFAFESAGKAFGNDVFVGFHRRLIPAGLVVKEPFNGREMNYVSSDSAEYQNAINQQTHQNNRLIAELTGRLGDTDKSRAVEYPVNVVRHDHQTFLTQTDRQTEQPLRAILLTLYHSGTANTEKPALSVAELVMKLRKKRLVFFGATENGEPVDLHSYETSVRLREAGVVPLYDMHKDVAMAKLAVLTGHDLSNLELIDAMLRNTVHEIDESRVFAGDVKQLKALYT